MKSFFKAASLVVAAIALSSCGNNADSSGEKLGAFGYAVLGSGAGLTRTGANLAGTGTVRFDLTPTTENSVFELSFQLQPGGSITLVTNSDVNLQRGVRFLLRQDGTKLKLSSLAFGNPAVATDEVTVNATAAPVRVKADVHGHGDADFKVNGTLSAELGFANAEGNARRWGLVLDKVASVTIHEVKQSSGAHGRP